MVLLEAIAHVLGIRFTSSAALPSRTVSSAGTSPIASPVADLHGLSLHTPSVRSSAGSSDISAHSSIISLFNIHLTLLIFLTGVHTHPVEGSGAGAEPLSRASSLGHASVPGAPDAPDAPTN